MAKQTGVHKLRGKVGGLSYYKQKYVTDDLVKSINPGMSGRVKTAPEYANTRLYNREFGYCGATAARFTSMVLNRWRYILNPFTNGKFLADLKRNLLEDTTSELGQRNVTLNQSLLDEFNKYFKAPFIDHLSPVNVKITADEDDPNDLELEVEIMPQFFNESKMSKIPGVEGFRLAVQPFQMFIGQWSDSLQRYTNPRSQIVVAYSNTTDVEFGSTSAVTLDSDITVTEFNNWVPGFGTLASLGKQMGGFVLTATPYKVVNNEKIYLVDQSAGIMLCQGLSAN